MTKVISENIKIKARHLRGVGKTHREITRLLKTSLGSAHLWTKNIQITPQQKKDIMIRAAKSAFNKERRRKLSLLARNNPKLHLLKYSRQDLLSKIQSFYHKYGRIPLKREFNMHRSFLRHFKSWNEAIKLSGFNTNPVLFAKKFNAADGHRCDSFTEKIIDDWLYDKEIKHERNFKYPETRMTADFLIGPNKIIEFFGLAGIQSNYDSIIQKKKLLCKKLGFTLIELYQCDVFPLNKLGMILKRAAIKT